MPYIHEVIRAGITEEHRKYYTWYLHPIGGRREKKKTPSEERVKRSNLRQAERKLRGLMNENFQDGDYLLTLDFHEHKPRDSTEMQKLVAGFIRALRYRLKKEGRNPKYLYVMEVGPRGSRHVHMVLERCSLALIADCWKYGGLHCTPLYSGGQYRQIAAYFLKYALKTEATEERLLGKRWYGSRNLKKPQVTKRIVLSSTFREEAPVKPGWHLDKEAESRGVTLDGYQYYEYTYIRTKKDEGQNIYAREDSKRKWGLRLRGRGAGASDVRKKPDHGDRDDRRSKEKRSGGGLLAQGLAKIKGLFRR